MRDSGGLVPTLGILYSGFLTGVGVRVDSEEVEGCTLRLSPPFFLDADADVDADADADTDVDCFRKSFRVKVRFAVFDSLLVALGDGAGLSFLAILL
jgi:hypothetical protein